MPWGVELSEEVIDAEVEEGFVRLRKEKSIELVRPSRQPTEIPITAAVPQKIYMGSNRERNWKGA